MAIEKEFKIALVIILVICVACLSCFIVTAIVTNTPEYKAKMAAREAEREQKEEEKRLRKAAEEKEREEKKEEKRLRKAAEEAARKDAEEGKRLGKAAEEAARKDAEEGKRLGKAAEENARKKAEEEKRLHEEEAKYKFSKKSTRLRKFEAVLLEDDPGRHKDVLALALNTEGRLEIRYKQSPGFLDNRGAILAEAKEWCQFVYEEHDFPFVKKVVLLPVATTKDRYGREKESIVARISLGKEVGRKIVYNNITSNEFGEILLLDGEFRPLVNY